MFTIASKGGINMLNDYEIQKQQDVYIKAILQLVASLLILFLAARFIPIFVEEVQAIQQQESEQLKVRVIANSSSAKDQQQKQLIVDKIQTFISGNGDNFEHIHMFEQIYQDIQKSYPDLKVTMHIGDNLIPAKVFNGRFYPQNYYESVVFKIGSGRGENWFCALFPTLCLPQQPAKSEKPPSFFHEWWTKKKQKAL